MNIRRYSSERLGGWRVEMSGVIVRSDWSSIAQKYGVAAKPPRKRVIPSVGNRKPEERGVDGSGCEKKGV